MSRNWSSPRHGPRMWSAPTTLIDILFLTLTFFITVAAFRDNEKLVDVALPATEIPQARNPHTPIIITVTAGGGVFMGQKQFQFPELRRTLRDLARDYPEESVVIRGDRESHLGVTVQVMDLAYAVGLKNVLLATTKPGSGL